MIWAHKDDAIRPCIGTSAQLVAHATTTNHLAAYVIHEQTNLSHG